MAGRLFKERFVDALEPCYYAEDARVGRAGPHLPAAYSVWRQCGLDEDVEGRLRVREDVTFRSRTTKCWRRGLRHV